MNASLYLFVALFWNGYSTIGKCPFIYRICATYNISCFYINSSSKGYDNHVSNIYFFIINTTTNSQVIHRNLKNQAFRCVFTQNRIINPNISIGNFRYRSCKSVGVWFVYSFDSIFSCIGNNFTCCFFSDLERICIIKNICADITITGYIKYSLVYTKGI